MVTPERKFDAGSDYRYGFNGKENDNEVKDAGNSIHFEFREYDPRLGKFTSIDPIANNYPWQSPYAFAANSPISLVDVLGMGPGDPRNHTVVKGDNLTKVAKKYGVTVDDLLKMNKIKDKNKISIGQNLIVNPEADFSNNPRGGYQNPQNSFGPELKVNNIAQIGLDFVFGKGTENTVVVSGGALRSVQNWNVVQSMVQSGVGRLKYNGKPGDFTVMNYRPGNLPTNIKKGLSEAIESIAKGEDPWKNNSQNSPIHVLGSFNMTIRINANGTTATVCIYDSKTFSSFSDNNAGSESNKARGKSDNKYLTNTYQRYLWNVNLFNGLPIEYIPPVTITSGRN